MHAIRLGQKIQLREGRISWSWFENPHVGLKRTLFHQLTLPLEPLDSGLDYVEQPESTEICFDWLELGLDDPADVDGVIVNHQTHGGMEASIYLGAAHNPIDVVSLRFRRVEADLYEVAAQLSVDFEYEGVAQNETLDLTGHARYTDDA